MYMKLGFFGSSESGVATKKQVPANLNLVASRYIRNATHFLISSGISNENASSKDSLCGH